MNISRYPERHAIYFADDYLGREKMGKNCSGRFHSSDVDVTRCSRSWSSRRRECGG